jgi:hypothetical protein
MFHMAIGYCPFSHVLLKYSNNSVTAGSYPLSIVVIAVKVCRIHIRGMNGSAINDLMIFLGMPVL